MNMKISRNDSNLHVYDSFSIDEMNMQKILQEKYKDKWEKISPEELKIAYINKFNKNMKRW